MLRRAGWCGDITAPLSVGGAGERVQVCGRRVARLTVSRNRSAPGPTQVFTGCRSSMSRISASSRRSMNALPLHAFISAVHWSSVSRSTTFTSSFGGSSQRRSSRSISSSSHHWPRQFGGMSVVVAKPQEHAHAAQVRVDCLRRNLCICAARSCFVGNQLFHIFREDIDLKIDHGANWSASQRGQPERGRDQRYLEEVIADSRHRQRHPVDGDRPLLHNVTGQLRRQRDAHHLPVLRRRPGGHLTGAVDVALHDMSAQTAVDRGGPFEVDRAAHRQRAEA